MKRIGIMGGTFNPIHYAHLILAEQAYKQYALDGVIFIPSKHPPHKNNSTIASDEHRMNMVKLAINETPYFTVSDIEYKREGITYTADTLIKLNIRNADTKYYFIVGGDSLLSFETWHEPETILRNAVILAAGRSSVDDNLLHHQINKLIDKYSADDFIPDIRPLLIPATDISSEYIRSGLSLNRNVVNLLPCNVIKYIRDNNLYKDAYIESIISYMKQNLSEKRFYHTLGVAQMACNLAEYHNEDVYKAYVTGLLHDIGKSKSVDELLKDADRFNLKLSKIELQIPGSLLHSKLGVYYAKELFNVVDEKILDAIKYHTTGKPGMNTFEKIIYISDYIEPHRSMNTEPSLDIIRSTAYNNIDLAVKYALWNTIKYINSKGDRIDPITLETYSYYKTATRRNEDI